MLAASGRARCPLRAVGGEGIICRKHVGRAALRRRTSRRDVPTTCRFMESLDLQNWMHLGTMNRSWFLALPNQWTAAVDSLSAIDGGEGRGEVVLFI